MTDFTQDVASEIPEHAFAADFQTFLSEDEAVPLPVVSSSPPALPPAESSEPLAAEAAPLDLESPQPEPTVPAAGQPWPVAVPPAIAAQRLAPGTGPTTVVSRPANTTNTGL